jgi:prepilin-type N-terminal cleavage/methylation domain-containing protein
VTTRLNTRGFTLIEMMVASTILILGLLGVAGLLTSSYSKNSNSKQITIATTIAEKKMEELKASGFAGLPIVACPGTSAPAPANSSFSVSHCVASVGTDNWLKQVQVTVTWQGTKQISLSAYVLK